MARPTAPAFVSVSRPPSSALHPLGGGVGRMGRGLGVNPFAVPDAGGQRPDGLKCCEEGDMYRVRVDREREFVQQGSAMTLVEFTLEKQVEQEGEFLWRGLASGANAWPRATGPDEKGPLLFTWAREIAPDGERP